VSDVDCIDCFFFQLGCRCEDLMCAGCIPQERTQKEKKELIGRLEKFLAYLKSEAAEK